jgi:hypothetical protein
MFWSGREEMSPRTLHAPAQVTFWRVEPRPDNSLAVVTGVEPASSRLRDGRSHAVELHHKRLAGAEGFEPTRGLINNQVPFQLGYAPMLMSGPRP